MYYICFALAMIAPLAMLIVGVKWFMSPPAYKADGFAYRTAVTERGPAVWEFAHTHIGKLWGRFGAILLVLSIILLLVFKEYYQKFILWLLVGQMVIFCITVFMIEILTKSLYDENGELIPVPGEASQKDAQEMSEMAAAETDEGLSAETAEENDAAPEEGSSENAQ